PAQTGLPADGAGDAEFALAAMRSGQLVADAYGYRFLAPAAPVVAARAEGAAIHVGHLRGRFDWLRKRYDCVLVAGAGGLLVPLAPDRSMADLASALDLPLVIVARPGLGTLNHTLLTLEAARARGLPLAGVVLAGWREPADLATRTNPALLTELGAVPLLGVLPWDDGLSVEHGRTGALPEWAASALVPTLGGTFDAAAFLSSLSAT